MMLHTPAARQQKPQRVLGRLRLSSTAASASTRAASSETRRSSPAVSSLNFRTSLRVATRSVSPANWPKFPLDAARHFAGNRQQRPTRIGDLLTDDRTERGAERALDEPRERQRQFLERRGKRGVSDTTHQRRPARRVGEQCRYTERRQAERQCRRDACGRGGERAVAVDRERGRERTHLQDEHRAGVRRELLARPGFACERAIGQPRGERRRGRPPWSGFRHETSSCRPSSPLAMPSIPARSAGPSPVTRATTVETSRRHDLLLDPGDQPAGAAVDRLDRFHTSSNGSQRAAFARGAGEADAHPVLRALGRDVDTSASTSTISVGPRGAAGVHLAHDLAVAAPASSRRRAPSRRGGRARPGRRGTACAPRARRPAASNPAGSSGVAAGERAGRRTPARSAPAAAPASRSRRAWCRGRRRRRHRASARAAVVAARHQHADDEHRGDRAAARSAGCSPAPRRSRGGTPARRDRGPRRGRRPGPASATRPDCRRAGGGCAGSAGRAAAVGAGGRRHHRVAGGAGARRGRRARRSRSRRPARPPARAVRPAGSARPGAGRRGCARPPTRRASEKSAARSAAAAATTRPAAMRFHGRLQLTRRRCAE